MLLFVLLLSRFCYDDDGETFRFAKPNFIRYYQYDVIMTQTTEVVWVMRFKTPPEWFVRMSFCIGQKSTLLRSTTFDRIPVVSNFPTIFRVRCVKPKKYIKNLLHFQFFINQHSFFTTTSILYKSILYRISFILTWSILQ